jgi:hypothetical protein
MTATKLALKEVRYKYWTVSAVFEEGFTQSYYGFRRMPPGSLNQMVKESIKHMAIVSYEDTVDFYALENDYAQAFQELRKFLEDTEYWHYQVLVLKLEAEEVIGQI